MVAVCAVAAAVFVPAAPAGESGQEQTEQVPGDWKVTQWDDVTVPEVFAITPGIRVIDVGGQKQGTLETLVGYDDDGINRYVRHSCGAIGFIDRSPAEFGDVSAAPCSVGSPISDLNNYCCMPPDGIIFGDVFSSAGTLSFSSGELQIPMESPYNVTVLPFPGGSQVSTVLQCANSHCVASTYDITNGEVDLFMKPQTGSWTGAGSVDCDSPMSDSVHWAMCASAVGLGAYVACAMAGQVSLNRVDLSTGTPVWTSSLGTIVDPPNGFQYQGCNSLGEINLANGSSGEAVACYFGDQNGLNICVSAPTDQATPPMYTRCQQFPGALPGDRHDIDGDGKMVYYVGPDPGGDGTRVILLNCGDLGGECSTTAQTIGGFTPDFTAFAPETIVVDGNTRPVIWEQKIVIAGGSDHVYYYTIDLPFAFYNFETGSFDLWDRVVGGTRRDP